MMHRLFFILLCVVKVHAVDLFIDQFHGLQKRIVFRVEHAIDIQESILLGGNLLDGSTQGIGFNMSLWETSYRRYVNETTSTGIFYSFGIRAGMVNLRMASKESEQELSVMPFYDIGVKGQLSERWFHILRLEAGYFMLYSKNININHMLGLQFTPFFSFGYSLD